MTSVISNDIGRIVASFFAWSTRSKNRFFLHGGEISACRKHLNIGSGRLPTQATLIETNEAGKLDEGANDQSNYPPYYVVNWCTKD